MEVEQVNNLVVPLPNENPLCPGPSPDVRIPPSFICTGDEIVALEEGWMKGHGTEIVNGKLYATGERHPVFTCFSHRNAPIEFLLESSLSYFSLVSLCKPDFLTFSFLLDLCTLAIPIFFYFRFIL